MAQLWAASFEYASTLFGAGFVLGTLRYLSGAPEPWATLVEVPLMLLLAWVVVAPRMLRRWRPLPRGTGMGALVVLNAWELALSVAATGGARLYVERLASPGGLVGLAAQAVAAHMPTVREALG